ncbi:hypothetical protein SLS60_007007 [Paraconiothyrium brasiliense]|uniref:F-box domain-containing protein n=1 Tax=Paraconiothyrium brasiliense TaxID=300254 RepID=A0ABR3R876_9PLEO
MPPQGLSGLPEEILLYIVEAACEGEKFTRIHNLLVVNRQISRLALPFLYRHIRDGDFVNDESDAFRRLVLTLLFDPAKAQYVQSFSLEHGVNFGGGLGLANTKGYTGIKKHGCTAEQHAELQRLIDILNKYEVGEEARKRWKKDYVNDRHWEMILALLLARLPNVRELTILDAYDEYWEVFEYVVDALTAACQEPKTGVTAPFTRLEKVNMGDGKQIGDGDNFHQEDPDKWFLDLKPKSTNYTSLTFRPSSMLLSEHLVRFLATAKALETFDYHIGHAWAWIPLSTPELSRALNQHKETLKSITLQRLVLEVEDDDEIITPMSFKEYAALTHLNIAFDLLFGCSDESPPDATAAQMHIVDALPESLETLEIVQCDKEEQARAATTAVSAVLRLKEERWPKLEKVTVAVMDPCQDILKGIQKESQDEGETHGVRYVATSCRECWVNGLEIGSPVPDEDE